MQPVDEEDMISIPIETLMKFITELPAGYRTILNLAVFEGMPHKEIAKTLGLSLIHISIPFLLLKVNKSVYCPFTSV